MVEKTGPEGFHSAFPIISAKTGCHWAAILPETAICGLVSWSEFEWDSGAFAVVPGIRTAEITVTIPRLAAWTENAAGNREWSLDAWHREPAFRLAAEGAALHRCSITVNGMTAAAKRGRLRHPSPGLRFAGRVAEAQPSGRIICLQHQQLNL